MKRSIPIYQVDAFTHVPFKGNPAGVCLIEESMSDKWMQSVASEMNLSETAFLVKDGNRYLIRFFTPEAEIPLCGHATLSSAHIIYETGLIPESEKLFLISKAGELTVWKDGNWITMDFPSYGVEKIEIPTDAMDLLGGIPSELYKTGHGWSLAVFDNEEEVLKLKPDFRAMKGTIFGDTIVTAPATNSDYDFCVRCFVPALGINEDPVTGSAHCSLTPFWYKRTGKENMVSKQVSVRGGVLRVSFKGERVNISGEARTILRGELLV